ncbi:hypothetical protein BG004_000267 [Podila humilis]|nr:hypothetical protein BG004_000267 [Podila humilis]
MLPPTHSLSRWTQQKTVDYLKNVIKTEKTSTFSNVAADNLTLWHAFIPNSGLHDPITIDALDDKTELASPSTQLRILFPESPGDNTYIIAQRPPQPRAVFARIRNDLQPGDVITISRMGQSPNYFGSQGIGQTLVVTEQMLELWEDMSGDHDHMCRRILSGPMGIGKSYLSYFFVARAYAEGWLALYIGNSGSLTMWIEARSSQEVLERFLALNKDILTAAELMKLVDGYDGTVNISTHAVGRVFKDLLKSTSRKTLLLVDEHWQLFQNELHPPKKVTKRQLCEGRCSDEHFEMALYHHFVITTKPILLYATDLNDNNPTVISLDFSHCETLKTGMSSLGPGHEKVLTLGYKGYPRFRFMLGPMFFHVSVNDFASHNRDSADTRGAFNDRDSEDMNEVERYMNDMFGPSHSAMIDNRNNKFSVNKNGVPVPGFRIMFICGSRGKPTHRALVKIFPDVLHVCFEELKDTLFRNIVLGYSDFYGQ